MATSVIFEEQVEIPLDLRTLADFRTWALSDAFPQRGRIDFIGGRIEVDMSPEDFFCHGTLKTEIVRVLSYRVKTDNLGHLVIDSTRVSCPEADLSAEPDIVFVSHDTLNTGRARLVTKSGSELGRYGRERSWRRLRASVDSSQSPRHRAKHAGNHTDQCG